MPEAGQNVSKSNNNAANATAWAVALARQDLGKSVDVLKEDIDGRRLDDKIGDALGALPRTVSERPDLVAKNIGQGAAEAAYSSVGLIGDILSFPIDVTVWGVNSLTRATVNYQLLPKDEGGLFSYSESMAKKVKIAPEISPYLDIEDKNGEMTTIKNPYADSLWFTRQGAGFVTDAVTFTVTAGTSGSVFGLARGIATKPLGLASKTFKNARNIDRLADTAEILQSAEKTGNIAKEARLLSKADNMLNGSGHRTIFDKELGKVFGEASGSINSMEQIQDFAVKKLAGKARKVTKLRKQLAEATDDTQKIRLQKKIDKAMEKLERKLDDTVNRVIKGSGKEKLTGEEVVKLVDEAKPEVMGYGAAIKANTQFGAYKGLRIADPVDKPLLQIGIGGFLMGLNYHFYKKEVEAHKQTSDDIVRTKIGVDTEEALEIMEEFEKYAPDQIGNKKDISLNFNNRMTSAVIDADHDTSRGAKPYTKQNLESTLTP